MDKPTIPEVEALMTVNLWSEAPIYDRDWWQDEVTEGNTQLGYWDWVKHMIEADNG